MNYSIKFHKGHNSILGRTLSDVWCNIQTWNVFLKILQYSQKKTGVVVLFVSQLYWKEIPAQVFSCEYCEFLRKPSWRISVDGCFCYFLNWSRIVEKKRWLWYIALKTKLFTETLNYLKSLYYSKKLNLCLAFKV